MFWAVIIPGLMLGLVSSAHCVGMCGPLALALPLQHIQSRYGKALGIVLYNTGRISAYLLLGLLFGWLGRNLLVPGFQKWVAIAGGGMMVGISVLTALKGSSYRLPFIQVLFRPVYALLNYYLKSRQLSGTYVLGVANGLLPCGLVYMAATAAFMWGDVVKGMLFMAMYGIGTVPAMALLSLMGYMISLPVRNTIRKIAPCVVLLMGALLLMRGLDLHLPFISALPIPGVHEGGVGCSPFK